MNAADAITAAVRQDSYLYDLYGALSVAVTGDNSPIKLSGPTRDQQATIDAAIQAIGTALGLADPEDAVDLSLDALTNDIVAKAISLL